jgi:hypothetical protein
MGRYWVASLLTKDHVFRQYVPRIPGHGKITARPACHTRPLEVNPLWKKEEVDAEAAIQLLTLFSFQCGQGHEEGKGLLEGIAASKKSIFEGIRGVGDNTVKIKRWCINKKVVASKNICAPTCEAVFSEMVDQISFACSRFPDCPRWIEEREKGV